MSHPFDAFTSALGGEAGEPTTVRTTADVVDVTRREHGARYASQLSRALHGIGPGANLPARGTARRAAYEKDRREYRALGAGKRPSRGLQRRTERSLKSPRGRIRELMREATARGRRVNRKVAALRRDGGGLGFRGTVIVSKDPEGRTMPAGAESGRLQPIDADAWDGILEPWEAGDRDAFAAALSEEFGEAYGLELSIEDVEELWIE